MRLGFGFDRIDANDNSIDAMSSTSNQYQSQSMNDCGRCSLSAASRQSIKPELVVVNQSCFNRSK